VAFGCFAASNFEFGRGERHGIVWDCLQATGPIGTLVIAGISGGTELVPGMNPGKHLFGRAEQKLKPGLTLAAVNGNTTAFSIMQEQALSRKRVDANAQEEWKRNVLSYLAAVNVPCTFGFGGESA
jgi:hypothetical protein